MSVLSPLNTKRIWLESLDIRLARAFNDGNPEDYQLNMKVDMKKREDEWAFRIGLSLEFTPTPNCICRYERIAVSTVGLFELPQDTSEDFVRQVVPFNCLAILHGFSRGVVAQVTGLNDGGPFLLPTVNFLEALKSDDSVGARGRKRASKKRKTK